MAADPLTIVFWDVQHGSATFIKTPNGTTFAIDLGTGSNNDKTFSPLLNLKYNWGVTQLDGLVITHPHRDHLDDIDNLDELPARVLVRPKHLTERDIRGGNKAGDKAILDKYLALNARYNQPVAKVGGKSTDPFLAVNNGGVTFKYFTPRGCDTGNLNNHSIVTVISYATSTILIPGDNEANSWKELLTEKGLGDAISTTDILVAAHHGRDSGYYGDLFNYFDPNRLKLTVVSDGPEVKTSATNKYCNRSAGWKVFYRGDKESENRQVLTTRSDGVVVVTCGYNDPTKPFLQVTAS